LVLPHNYLQIFPRLYLDWLIVGVVVLPLPHSIVSLSHLQIGRHLMLWNANWTLNDYCWSVAGGNGDNDEDIVAVVVVVAGQFGDYRAEGEEGGKGVEGWDDGHGP
jgi:hypothetical protein